MGELQEEYGDRIHFNVVPAEETAKRGAEIAELGFTAQKHGLVAYTAKGEVLVKLPGHSYGKPEIEVAVKDLLRP